MAVHPGPEKRRVPAVNLAELEPIRRALHDNKDWYEDLVEHSHDLLCIHNLAGRLLAINPAPALLLGYSVEEMLQIPMRELVPAEFRDQFDAYLKQIERTGEARGLLTVLTRSGERRIWEFRNTLRTEGVVSPLVRGIAHDVTEQRETEKLLREMGERLLSKLREGESTIGELKLFRTLVDQCNDAIEVVDPETLRFLDVNEKACSELGYRREELLSLRAVDINTSVTEASAAEIIEELRKSGSLVMEAIHRRKDGSTFPVELSVRQVQLDREYLVVIARDLTQHKLAEARLREYARVVESLDEKIMVVDREYRYVIANRTFLNYRGLERERAVGHRVSEIIGKEVFEKLVKHKMDECFQGKAVQYELRLDFPKLGERDVLAKYFPIEGPNGIDRIACILQDITERKRSQHRLEEYERVVEGMEEMIVVMDRDYRYLIANRAALNYRGLKEEQLVGHSFGEQLAAEKAPAPMIDFARLKMAECFQGRVVQYELKDPHPRLGERDLHLSYFPIAGPTGIERIACIVRDVTERKQAEEALRTSERRQHTIAKQLEAERARLIEAQAVGKVGSWEVELPSLEITWSEQTHRIFETDHSTFKPRRPDFVEFVHPEDRAKVDSAFQSSLANGAPSNVEYRIVLADGRVKVLEEQWRVFHDEQARPIRLVGTCRDITERKRAEEALRDAKEFSENLIRTANVIVLGLDTGGNVKLFNEAAEEITGYTFEELRGKNWSILVPRDRFPHAWGEFERLMDGTAGPTFENPIITKTGEERYIAWRNSVVRVNGRVVATISFGNDITKRKRAEESLRHSEENYRQFVAQSSEGIYREEMDSPVSIDRSEDELVHHILHDGHIEECNDALAAMYGLTSAKELRGKHWAEMMPPDEPQNVEMTRQFVRSGFRVLERESHEVDIHGNPKIFLNSLIGTVENGMLVRTWGIQRDITEKIKLEEGRQKAEEALRENVAQLQKVTEELRLAKEKLSEEKLYLEEAIDTELGFGEIIGSSSALKEVMAKVAKVAPSDATVLLLGETGTGKELVARALHRKSLREGNSFIKLNCAAIPSGLLESELFGHEKGAFTGAVARKLGRLELADRGTLFLDEIGEIPLSLQPKLLRVLQDQEFERLGGTQTLKVNFRLLAATNRDLLQSVKAHEFRSDLYYRLNVFPILIPPLRERREDIRPLVEHFVRKFAVQTKKSITSIPSKTMETLVRWDWPGNIRELENFMERSVILTPGSVLQAPLSELEGAVDKSNGGSADNLRDSVRDKERERILRVLRDCHGRLGGPDGAAARLGLKRTTLQSKLDHLGIKPGGFRG
jgi:PAS domain S-box-containing protein